MKGTFLDSKTEKIYDDNTLIGNWFENRAVMKKCPPGTQQKLEPISTEYFQHYSKPATEETLTDIFMSSYVQGFRNRARAHHSSVKFFNAQQFLSNLTTTSDVYYRIKTGRDRCGRIVKEGMPTLGFDMLRSYGNSTKFGLREHIRERERKLKDIPADVSFTRDFFKCPHKKDYATIVKKQR